MRLSPPHTTGWRSISRSLWNWCRNTTKNRGEVSFYAQKMSLTPKYLNYISCSITKRTCKQIINTYVVNQLKNDLRYSDKNIQEIAYEYNFANQSFLGSFFKKLVGVSPRAFRNEKES